MLTSVHLRLMQSLPRFVRIPRMARTSWHPAFAQAIEHELEDSKDALTFEAEHQLTAEPLMVKQR